MNAAIMKNVEFGIIFPDRFPLSTFHSGIKIQHLAFIIHHSKDMQAV
jgi:hypothetical protein